MAKKNPTKLKKGQMTGIILEAAADNDLNPKQTVVLKELVENPGQPVTKILTKAGYSYQYAAHARKAVIGNPKVQSALIQVLKTVDWDSKVLEKYREIFELTADKHGMTILKALDQIHKLRGDYSPNKSLKVVADIPALPPEEVE